MEKEDQLRVGEDDATHCYDVEKEDQLRAGEETDRAMWRRARSAESGRGDGQGDVEKEDQLRVGLETDRAMWRRKIS